MRTNCNKISTKGTPRTERKGAATTELAITLPILLVFLLGTIDTGQFANVYQTISNASREGARVAAKTDTTDTSEIQAAVVSYLDNAFANASSGQLNSAVSVQVSLDASGTPLNGNLMGVPAGTAVRVNVSMPYETVRYIPGMDDLDSRTVQTATVMRRQ